MIIDDLDFVSIAIAPNEADPSLLIDPDAVLRMAIAAKFLKPVARWNA